MKSYEETKEQRFMDFEGRIIDEIQRENLKHIDRSMFPLLFMSFISCVISLITLIYILNN